MGLFGVTLYAIISWIGPTKFTRLGAVYDFIDTIKGWLVATFAITAGLVGLIAGINAIFSAFGGGNVADTAVLLKQLLVDPLQNVISGK